MLDLKRLLVFREVAQQRSISRAAQALHYSQPAISHHIARLELELGTPLLRRRHDGIALTEAGEALLERAVELLDHADAVERAIGDGLGSGPAHVRLGAFASASATLVADAAGELRARHPDARMTLVEGEATDTLAALTARQIDVGVIFDDPDNPLPDDAAVALRFLFDDPMLLALPERHALAAEQSIELTALRDEAWIEGAGEETPCSLILVAACQRAGFEPRVAFNSGNFQVVQQLVAVGVGVALVPQLALTAAHPGLAVRRLAPSTPYRRIWLATRADADQPPAVADMLALLGEAAGRWASRSLRPGPPT